MAVISIPEGLMAKTMHPNEKFRKKRRPSKYKEEYCDKILEYFNPELFRTEIQEVATSTGVKEIKIQKGCLLPTLERFAFEIGVHKSTIYEWIQVYPEFSDAFNAAKQNQKHILIQHGLSGQYNSSFARFLAPNVSDLKDKTEVENKQDISITIDETDSGL